MERIFKIASRSGGFWWFLLGMSKRRQSRDVGGLDGTESIPRCSRAPRKLSSPPAWSLFTCTSTMCLLIVGMRREGTKQGGWERAGCDWVKRPCPNTATPGLPAPKTPLDLFSFELLMCVNVW